MAVSFTFYVTSVAALDKVAQALAPFLQADDCLSLSGDLGAGKTTFTAALVRALGLADSVTSPSFNLLHEYSEPCKGVQPAVPIVYHFDTYRLENSANFIASALDDYFGQALCIVEWGDLISDILPPSTIFLRFTYADSDTCTEIVNTKRLLEIVIPTTLWQQRQERGQNLVKLSEELKANRREI